MQWRNWIQECYSGRSSDVRPELCAGASQERLAAVEANLGLRLPVSLRELLLETDGVGTAMFLGGEWGRTDTDVWSCDRLEIENADIRADMEGPCPPPGAPEVAPLYFAPAGVDGILFAFLVRSSGPEDPAVYAHYPIEGEWRLISPTLASYFQGWTV